MGGYTRGVSKKCPSYQRENEGEEEFSEEGEENNGGS